MSKSKSKYNINQSSEGKEKRTYKSIIFDSLLELKFYKYLLELQSEGKIVNINLQPQFILQEKYIKDGKTILPIKYKADFEVTFQDGSIINYDVKGNITPEFRLKAKMFNYVYPDKVLKTISYSRIDGGWVDIDIIAKGRKERKKAKEKTKKVDK